MVDNGKFLILIHLHLYKITHDFISINNIFASPENHSLLYKLSITKPEEVLKIFNAKMELS